MLLDVKKNTKNKSIRLTRAFFVSITAVTLAACANNAKNSRGTAIVKTDKEQVSAYSVAPQVMAYSVVPVAKPAIEPELKATALQNSKLKNESSQTLSYFSESESVDSKVGRASWYGAAFNGRLTANGEVYDMHNLTAAHPTMPLPSYARVTNLENGASLIVRVNDRGPFAADRVIDLSKQAATMLDYKDEGLADVKVEYVGRAPVEGNDNEFLLASYKPGNITAETLLSMAGMNLVNSYDGSVLNNSTSTIQPIIGGHEITDTGFPKLPDIGPLPNFKPQNSELLAFADVSERNQKEKVFDSVLKPQSVKSSKDGKLHLADRKPLENKENSNHQPDETANLALNQSDDNADQALQIAWARGVSAAFSIGSER